MYSSRVMPIVRQKSAVSMPCWSCIVTRMLYEGSLYTSNFPWRSVISPREGYKISLRKAFESALLR